MLQLDAAQIQQALYNIIRNSAQAVNSKTGRISIQTSSNDLEVVLTITDNGSGISPEHMGALFEPYKTTKTSGTGLGLLIVRRILRDHGGEIEIDSEPEKATTVRLFFPRFDKRVRLLEEPATEKPLIDIETSE